MKHETKETLTLLFSVVSKAKNPSNLKCLRFLFKSREGEDTVALYWENRKMFLFNKQLFLEHWDAVLAFPGKVTSLFGQRGN